MDSKIKIDLSKVAETKSMRLLRESESVINDLASAPDAVRMTYPESEFRRHFLPVVTGDAYRNLPEGYTVERLQEEVTSCWLAIAGNAALPVDVVEPDGSVAFTVPPVMNRSLLNISQPRDQPGLRHLNNDYQNKKTGMPAVAERLMTNGLSHKLTHLLSGEVDRTEAEQQIAGMRNYYGIKTPNTQEKTSGKETPNDFMGEMEF